MDAEGIIRMIPHLMLSVSSVGRLYCDFMPEISSMLLSQAFLDILGATHWGSNPEPPHAFVGAQPIELWVHLRCLKSKELL